MKMVNLTQHAASPVQANEGVFEPSNKEEVKALITFNDLPPVAVVEAVASKLVAIAKKEEAEGAMIGGAPFLMFPLHAALKEAGLVVSYAFSKRESVESVQEDGSVIKKAVFNHKGFVSF